MIGINKILEQFGLEYFNRYYGIYKGFVHSNEDPDNLGRLQIIVPKVYGKNVYKKWALSKGIYCGKGVGSFWLPNKDDTIWVSFEGGDIRFPVWEYGWWRDGDVPENAEPEIKVFQTTSGHRMTFDDKNELIRIKDKHGHIVELNENGVSIVSDVVSLGNLTTSAEPAVLGNTAISLLNEFRDDIGNLGTIVTSTGVTSTISTSPQWASLVAKWDAKWEDFLSEVVTLD
jgi:hypothetical protein